MGILQIKQMLGTITGKLVDLDQLIQRRCARYILAYHRIVPPEMAQREHVHASMWASPETFASQISWMMKVGEVVDINRIMDFERECNRPLFAITFDDGWRDNYQYALPALMKFGVTATIFLATDAVETGHLFWPEEIVVKTCDRAERIGKAKVRAAIAEGMGWTISALGAQGLEAFVEYLKELPAADRKRIISRYYQHIEADSVPIEGCILSWREIRDMRKCGIKFGSHTHTHAILKCCSDEEIVRELNVSKRILQERLGEEIDLFCYPNARYNAGNAALIKECGYRAAFRLHNLCLLETESPYFIPRVLVNEATCKNEHYFKMKLLKMARQ